VLQSSINYAQNQPRHRRSVSAFGPKLRLGCLLIIAWWLSLAAIDGFAVEAWTRWEHALTSTKTYADPCGEVAVKVNYRGPRQSQITGLGFWDGGDTFKLRMMFPSPGRWAWQTICLDTNNLGLHQQSGSVEVVRYSGHNPLYEHGYPRVAADHRHLAYADGTPFLWLGDTAWATPMNTKWEDWQTYVRDRVSKRFTILQVFCASDWAGSNDWQSHPPFLGPGLTRINPPIGPSTWCWHGHTGAN
jgi:hypothetical protein